MSNFYGTHKRIKDSIPKEEEEEKGYNEEVFEEEQEQEPPKKKVGKAPSSTTKEDGDNDCFNISDNRKVTVKEFRGKIYVDIREYYEKDGEKLPGKKGISLTVEQWEKLKKLIPRIDDSLEAKQN